MSNAPFTDLIDKRVKKVYISSDNCVLVFVCDDGFKKEKFAYKALGDCCSGSWIEHIDGLSRLIGNTVFEVVEKEMPQPPQGDYESLQAYGWTLITTQGYTDIEMRNESNGYYGGWVQSCGVPPKKDGFRLLKEDL